MRAGSPSFLPSLLPYLAVVAPAHVADGRAPGDCMGGCKKGGGWVKDKYRRASQHPASKQHPIPPVRLVAAPAQPRTGPARPYSRVAPKPRGGHISLHTNTLTHMHPSAASIDRSTSIMTRTGGGGGARGALQGDGQAHPPFRCGGILALEVGGGVLRAGVGAGGGKMMCVSEDQTADDCA